MADKKYYTGKVSDIITYNGQVIVVFEDTYKKDGKDVNYSVKYQQSAWDADNLADTYKIAEEARVDTSFITNHENIPAFSQTASGTNTGTSTGTSTGTGKGKHYFSVPDKYKKHFKTMPGNEKGIVYMDPKSSIKQKEEFRDWLNENKAYDHIIQNSTKEYNIGNDKIFFGGLGPEDFEYEFIKGRKGEQAADDMPVQERRDLYFKHLGLDDQYLGKGTEVYNDPEFRGKFLEAYKERLPEEQFRQLSDESGQLKKFGFDHLDSDAWRVDEDITEEEVKQVEQETEPSIKICPCIDPETGYEINMKPIMINGKEECPECPQEDKQKVYGNPGKYFAPDVANMLAVAGQRDELFLPRLTQVNLEPGDVAYEDYATQVANQHDANQQLLETIENMSGTGQAGTAAAINAMSGNIAQTTQTISNVHNRNINRYNDYSRYAAGVENKEEMYNQPAISDWVHKTGVAKDNHQAFLNQKLSGLSKAYGDMWKHEMMASGIHEMDPDAPVKSRWDPSSWVNVPHERTPYDQYDTYVPSYGGSASMDSRFDTGASQVDQLVDKGWNRDDAIKYVTGMSRGTSGGGRRRNTPEMYSDIFRSKKGGNTPSFGVFLTGGIFE